jgi:CheY-like chemotaxis protein
VIDVLIVDDEEPARAVLREMLAEEGDVRRRRNTRRGFATPSLSRCQTASSPSIDPPFPRSPRTASW